MAEMTDDVLAALAPTGTLRAAINLGNSVLAQQGADGALQGVSVDLTNELARRLGRAAAFTSFEAAGKAFEALKTGDCDIAFLANEPARAAEVDFTPAYVLIEGTYMVRIDSPLKEPADVDRAGIRIAVGPNSAYDLYLTRTLKHATIVRAAKGGGRAMIDLFLAQNLEAAAGVRQPLEDYARTDSGVRVMAGRFMEIRQSMALQKGRPAGLRYLRNFVEEMKASGFIAGALRRSGQEATVAPPEA
ncbi:MAG TPA: ABC transporter substrate-binding protein [Xanthobacteraceae bacterium]|nr:ABC transporter substrate-binding protein [Xanthobacteraceae bacterium]